MASTSFCVCSSMPWRWSTPGMSSSAAMYSAALMFMPRCASRIGGRSLGWGTGWGIIVSGDRSTAIEVAR